MNPLVLRLVTKILGSILWDLIYYNHLNTVERSMFGCKIPLALLAQIKACVDMTEFKKELHEVRRIVLEAGHESLVTSLIKKINTVLKVCKIPIEV